MAERWCECHWPSRESATGMFCTEHLAEGHVSDCPYTAPGQVKLNYAGTGFYKCGYKPWAPTLQPTGTQESAMEEGQGGH